MKGQLHYEGKKSKKTISITPLFGCSHFVNVKLNVIAA